MGIKCLRRWLVEFWMLSNIFQSFALASTHAQNHAQDCQALLDFKVAFYDPTQVFGTWVKTTSCCTWSAVTCGPGGRVVKIHVTAPLKGFETIKLQNYTGVVGESLGRLSALKHLFLGDIFFDTPIPNALAKLTQLTYLGLDSCGLTGNIGVIGSLVHLTQLDLEMNDFQEPLPDSICKLTKLTYIDISRSNLVGSIPSCIGYSLKKLNTLNLEINSLTGSIPPSLGYLSKLTQLLLFANELTGNIPATLGKLKNIVTLDLSNNQLTGRVPASISIKNLKKLKDLNLAQNNLTGYVPSVP